MPKKPINKRDKATPLTSFGWDKWALLGILFITVLIYSNALQNGFIYFDDPESVVNNPFIRELSLANLVHYFTTPVQYMYMPLALISYAVDYQFGQIDPFIYHLDNLLIHLGCVVLVFWVFLLLTKKPRMAVFVTTLFAIHPINVDSVAWIATRANILATLFFLGALLCYSLYIEKNFQLRYLLLACLSFLLAACAKSSVVVLPFVLFLWDYFLGRKPDKRLFLEKIPFFVISLIFGIITLTMRVDVVQSTQYNLLDRVFIFFYAMADYFIRLLLPLQLSMSYAYPVKNGPWLPVQFYLAPVILVLIVGALYKLKVSKKVLIVGLAFFFLSVTLTQSVLLIDNFMANRYVHLSYIGLYFILAEMNENILNASFVGWQSNLRTGWIAALVVFALGFALLTFNRNFVWRDSMSLFDDVIAKQPGIAWVYGSRAVMKMGEDDMEGARRDFDESLKIDPNYAFSLYYRGVLNYRTAKYQAALTDLNNAILNDPKVPGTFRDRGKVKMALQDNAGALEDFNQAIKLNPHSDALYWRGTLQYNLGNYQAALTDLNTIISVVPNYDAAFYMRGLVKLKLNDQPGGCADVAKALSFGYQPSADQPVPSCP